MAYGNVEIAPVIARACADPCVIVVGRVRIELGHLLFRCAENSYF